MDVQLSRILSRDNTTVEQAQAIINAQASGEARLAVATDVIVNDGHIEDVDKKVLELHKLYTELSQKQ